MELTPKTVGMSRSERRRQLAVVVALALALAGCGQAGSPEAANQAADQFLMTLVRMDSDEAWSHLDPRSQHVVYNDDKTAFAHEVAEADWSRLSWEFGPVVDLDYAWEIHFVTAEAAIPDFLLERSIAGWGDPWLVMQVMTPVGKPYLILAEER